MMKFKASLLFTLALILGSTSASAASMYGKGATFSQHYRANDFSESYVVVGDGQEYAYSSLYTVDVGETMISYDFFGVSFVSTPLPLTNGPMILWDEVLNWTDWSIVSNTVSGFDISRILTGGDFIQLNLQGITANGSIVLSNNSLSPVPLPAAVWLFATALAGLFGFKARRRKSTANKGY